MPYTAHHRAHAVFDVHPVVPARSLHRSPARRKDHAFSLLRRNHLRRRLRSRSLLHQNELAAFKITPGPVKHENGLQWKIDFAIEVLMQAVVATTFIAQHERRGALLPARVAVPDELAVRAGII